MMADSLILINLHSAWVTTLSLRSSSPNKTSVCPKTLSMPSLFLPHSLELTRTVPSSMTYKYLSLPSFFSFSQTSTPSSSWSVSCEMQRLMKFSELVSKCLRKKGNRASVLAISMPSKGILSCYSLERTLNICCTSPFTSSIQSSILLNYNRTNPTSPLYQLLTQGKVWGLADGYGSYFKQTYNNNVMDKAEVCRLIMARSEKLRSLREQAANGNEEKKRLFMGAILQLLQDQKTQEPAYEQITQLAITASPYIVKALSEEIMIHLPQLHSQTQLNEHLILWGRIYDGSIDRSDYPNIKSVLRNVKIKQEDRELPAKFNQYIIEFEKNYTLRSDQRVEFFEDFDDSVVSESMDNESQLNDIIYLNIMEMKAARKKLESQKLSEEALNEQLNKIKYIITLKPPPYLTEKEMAEFKRETKWAKDFLSKQEEAIRRNQSLTINQTFNISGEVENIEIIENKDKYAMRRTLKEAPINSKHRQYFEESINFNSDKLTSKKLQQTNKNDPNSISAAISPVKKLYQDPKYVHHKVSSKNSSVSVYDDKKVKEEFFKKENSLRDSEVSEENIVVAKYKGGNPQTISRHAHTDQFKRTPVQKNNGIQTDLSSPNNELAFKSQTMNQWKRSDYTSPPRNTKCKLSEFTSEKRQRKQLAPREQLSYPEEYMAKPYFCHFETNVDFARFRRNCFESNFTLYSSAQLTVTCLLEKQPNSKIRVQILYVNLAFVPLQVQSVYKIPKCFIIQKVSKIAKKFQLHNTAKHIFNLQVDEFPLETCLLNLRYRAVDNGLGGLAQIPMPITILNFLEYLHFSEEEWIREWELLNDKGNKRLHWLTKHIEVDQQVVGEELQWILREVFVKVGSIEGYSIQDYGCMCYQSALNGLKFLVRISLRVDNIVSIELVSCRQVNENEEQFMKYCLNIWMMLLAKLYF